MCGIVGVIGQGSSRNLSNLTRQHAEIFSLLLYIDQIRGEDSTGMFLGDVRNVAKSKFAKSPWIKKAIPGSDFVREPDVVKLLGRYSSYGMMIGHNRAATRGTVSNKTAHPFSFKDITLVHNGTLSSIKDLPSTGDNSLDQVDSARIAAFIGGHKPAEYVKCLEQLDGAYTLIWYNRTNNQLYMARNNDRPLHFVDTSTALYLASEAEMLQWVIGRKLRYANLTPFSLEAGQMHVFDLGAVNRTKIEHYCTKVPFTPFKKTYVYHSTGITTYGGKTTHNSKTNTYSSSSFSQETKTLLREFNIPEEAELRTIITHHIPILELLREFIYIGLDKKWKCVFIV